MTTGTTAEKAIVFEAARTGYSIDQVRDAITVGDLKDMLDDFDDDTFFILSHDRGYTFGSITSWGGRYMEKIEGEWEEL